MFTGIIEETGEVVSVESPADSIRLALRACVAAEGVKPGDSLAVNGCCLTVVKASRPARQRTLAFDLLRETWSRTNLQFVRPGSLINLERSLPANGRLHGHFVTGHIDGLGEIRTFERRGNDWYLQIAAPKEILRYVVHKGAIAVDGMSLTVAEVSRGTFSIWIIPHTYTVTALRQRTAGDKVNLEADLLAKYTEKLLRVRG